ncbi:FAD-dependent monooxygenase [Thiotrichales bacterium 19S11-10]|nr:FAD-dependent monooxygenase [Thiotrichales bacterium 19S11-10]
MKKFQKNIVTTTDVIIVGGGLVGQALALAISPHVGHITIIDRVCLSKMQGDGFDSRAMALAYNALCILKGLDLWEKLKDHCEPIYKVHVSNKSWLGRVVLDCRDERKPALGAICAFARLYEVFYQSLLTKGNIQILSPAEIEKFNDKTNVFNINLGGDCKVDVKAKFVIICDGARSKFREQLGIDVEHNDYQQYASVCNVQLKRSHENIAYERFYDHGVVAMLPMTNQRSANVFTFPKEEKTYYEALSDDVYCQMLQTKFGYRLGRFLKVGNRSIFPLHLVVAKSSYKNNALLFGNALHFLHPVAGQGFNLCLRDIAVLTDLIELYGISDNNGELLERFDEVRQKDHQQTIWASHSLVQLFGDNQRTLKMLSSFGLHLTDRLPFGKRIINKMMMGDMIKLPQLAKQRVNPWEV